MGAPVSHRRRGAGREMETAAPPGSAEPRQPSEIYKLNRLSSSTQVGRNVNITLRTVSDRKDSDTLGTGVPRDTAFLPGDDLLVHI